MRKPDRRPSEYLEDQFDFGAGKTYRNSKFCIFQCKITFLHISVQTARISLCFGRVDNCQDIETAAVHKRFQKLLNFSPQREYAAKIIFLVFLYNRNYRKLWSLKEGYSKKTIPSWVPDQVEVVWPSLIIICEIVGERERCQYLPRIVTWRWILYKQCWLW